MTFDEMSKMKAEQAAPANNRTPAGYYGESAGRPMTPAERVINEANMRASSAEIDADRAKHALDFYTNHPEFAEFIGLIRSGAIQI